MRVLAINSIEGATIDTVSVSLLSKRALQLLHLIIASLFIGICAQIEIPLYFTPVPLTAQTMGVIVVGGLLGSRKGALAVIFYLIQGSMGFPVWAGGSAGFHIIMGPTGGYLIAYVFQAYLVGWCIERQQGFSFLKTFPAIVLSCLLELGIGTLWLGAFLGLKNVLQMGFYPFIPGEIVKSLLITSYLKLNKRGLSHANYN